MQYRRLLDVVPVHEGRPVRVQGRHGAHAVVHRNQTVPGLDGRPEQLQCVRVGRPHLDRFAAQLDPAPPIATVGDFDQHRALSIAAQIPAPVGHAEGLFLPPPRLGICWSSANVEHYGSCGEEGEKMRNGNISKLRKKKFQNSLKRHPFGYD